MRLKLTAPGRCGSILFVNCTARRRSLGAIRYTAHTLLHPPVDFAPARPTAVEWSSVSVDADTARGPNLTGEVRPLDWTQGPHEAWLS